MTVQDAIQVAAAVIVSLGGGGVIVAAISSHVGKLWANHFMAEQRHKHDRALEELRSDLSTRAGAQLEEIRATIELSKAKRLGAHQDKVTLYRMVVDLVAEMITDLGAAVEGARTYLPNDAVDRVLRFERDRLRAYGYLAMFAPQHVMDAYDRAIDYLMDVLEKKAAYDFRALRDLGVALLNEIRLDLAIDASPIAYRGHRQ